MSRLDYRSRSWRLSRLLGLSLLALLLLDEHELVSDGICQILEHLIGLLVEFGLLGLASHTHLIHVVGVLGPDAVGQELGGGLGFLRDGLRVL